MSPLVSTIPSASDIEPSVGLRRSAIGSTTFGFSPSAQRRAQSVELTNRRSLTYCGTSNNCGTILGVEVRSMFLSSRLSVLSCALAALAWPPASPGGEHAGRHAVADPGTRPRAARQPVRGDLQVRRGAGRAIAEDYRVFVHVVDADDERLWTDDQPAGRRPRSGSRGRPSSTRARCSSRSSRTSAAHIRSGCTRRRPARGFRSAPPRSRAARTRSRRSSCCRRPRTSSSSTRMAGIRPRAGAGPTVEWQWTKKEATLSFRNPKKDGTFYLDLDARTDLFGAPAGDGPFGRPGRSTRSRPTRPAQARDAAGDRRSAGDGGDGGAGLESTRRSCRAAGEATRSSACASSTRSSTQIAGQARKLWRFRTRRPRGCSSHFP